jgi:hypothetical protein
VTGTARRGSRAVRKLRAVREFLAVQEELHARAALAARPWEEELLHWSGGELHGWRLPPTYRRARSTTASGWCPGAEFTRRSPGGRVHRA